jgi:hypothetical protein
MSSARLKGAIAPASHVSSHPTSLRDASCPSSSLAPTFRWKECQEGLELIRVLSRQQFD